MGQLGDRAPCQTPDGPHRPGVERAGGPRSRAPGSLSGESLGACSRPPVCSSLRAALHVWVNAPEV